MTALTETSFTDFVTAHRFAVIHFWASWNGHDDQMRTFLGVEMPDHMRSQIAFASLDTDEAGHLELCRSHRVMNLPFLALYRDGVLFTTVTGMQKQVILRLFDELVSHQP